MRRFNALISFVLVVSIYLGGLSPIGLQMVMEANAQATRGKTQQKTMNVTPPNGLKFRLSEGVEGAENRTVTPPAKGDPLSQGDTDKLLSRIPPPKVQDDDQKDFAKREGSLPAPKTGKKIDQKFPASDQTNAPNIDQSKQSLEVIRYSPEGEIPLAPDLNVTFSQPMVAVTSQEEAAKVQPVQLSPMVEGKWRWLGTKTIMFDTTKRFPMATKFTAIVPAGTKSASGQTLQKTVTWTFTTPPPTVQMMFPQNQVTRRDALMFVSFDQEINPEAVLKTIAVTSNGKRIPTRLATQEEIDKDGSISYYSKQAQPKRWLVFRAITNENLTENALPADSPITVNVQKGTQSAEGPIPTNKDQVYSFRTYGAMKYVSGWCSYQGSKQCSPFDTWVMQFTNPIEASTFEKSMVKIEPPIEGMNVYPSGNYLYFQGYKKGRTTYKVTVDGGLKDTFGQTLGTTASATFNVGNAPSEIYSQGGSMIILDPNSKPTYSIYSTNHNSVKLKIYKVSPSDWEGFRQFMRYLNYDEQKRPPMPGKLVVDKVLQIQNKPDEMVETRIDVSPALDEGFGHAIIDIEPMVKRDKYDRTRLVTWAQATQIGLDAFVDNHELVGFATDIKNGKPVSGVEFTIYPNGKNLKGQQTSENTSTKSWWEWLTSWGTSDESIKETTATDENGNETEVESIPEAQTNRTGENGILRLPLADAQPKTQNLLIARKGKDVAFMPEQSEYYWQDYGSWYNKGDYDSYRWFVFNDRGIYKPKEEVTIKGYIRIYQGGKLGDIAELGDKAKNFSYVVNDPRGNEIAKGNGTLNAFGAFDFKFKLPDTANLGQANVIISTNGGLPGNTTYHYFQIQEFRRPEFEVSAKTETPAPHFVKGNAMVSVEAKYYAGGGLANAEANWTVTSTPTNYTPPNRGDFNFGKWVPWWRSYGNEGYTSSQYFKGTTDAAGKHLLKIDFEDANPPRPYSVRAEARVMDVNRQTFASATTVLVHPSDFYIGLKSDRNFVNKGEKIKVDSIISDIDGKLIAGRDAEVKAVLKDWTYEKGAWKEETVDEQTCTIKSTADVSKCEFIAKAGGIYTITGRVMDDKERWNETEFTVWVSGGKTPPKRNVEMEEAQLIPNKKDYNPGDVAEILVNSPFENAEGVLTLRRDGLVKTERFTMKGQSTVLKIPLEDKYLPNIYAQVDLVGASPRTDDKGEIDLKLPKRPAFASGQLNLSISTASRRLTVTADPQAATLEPGGETNINVNVKDSKGEPVANSEVAVVVVDESVLALTGYRIGDPMGIFYTQRGEGVIDYHSRKDILLGNPLDANKIPQNLPVNGRSMQAMDVMTAGAVAPAPMAAKSVSREARKKEKADMDDNEVLKVAEEAEKPATESQEETAQIKLRENFSALALFSPNVKTDSNGKAIVPIKLPDNLTRYRIMAVSVDTGKRFGGGESTLTAKQPLMVRPSAPRFMNFGDKIELPVVVQNQTDKEMTVNVGVRATNATLTAGGGKKVVVPANDRVEVRFPVSAEKAGTARFQFAVSSGKWSDAAEISLPVWTPATTEAFATYGTTEENGAIIQPVQTPGEVWSQFGGLEVTTSSTQLQELTDAFIYLYRYQFECSEQISSRMISVAALQDVLKAFKANEMPTDADLKKSFAKDIEILKGRQREDGSFGLWGRQRERYEFPFMSVHVAHALILAKAKGYKVPEEMLTKVKPYLKNVEKYYQGEWYSPQTRWTISAYALYVRDLMGDKDVAKAKALLKEATIEKMPFEALGWVLSVLSNDQNSTTEVEAIKRFLMNRTTETAATANFVTDYGDGAWVIMYSNRRADGVLLEALLKADPKNDLIPKLVRGLLDHRTKGRWGNTQENVFILLALDKYFQAYEKVTPDFAAKMWLGNTYAGEQIFKGRSVDSNQVNIPMKYLMEQGGTSNLIIDKQGPGRLYYRIGMKYAPKSLKLDPADYGFTVLRQYEAIDNADDVKQNPDGSWTFKAGARVRVRLTMVAQARRYHVALVDPLPAGLEILNPELAVTESLPADTGGGNTSVIEMGSRSYGYNYWWWRQNWFEHQNFRDERAEAFASLLWEGVYKYTYVTRATTPGQFVVPPAKAEEMYHPETFGRSGTDFVKVE
ncbi:MAG: Ig-like domain-containing protein [Pyrinomonadaceae bacterium]|nr:Ig-like domain-containing protein [Pyrinomonadaceae bacterium]